MNAPRTSVDRSSFDVAIFDVAIIGGGINGTGVARDLSKRGLRVYLAEKDDFGVGASGNSSGMIHGGVRYLLSDPQVTRFACADSGAIQSIAKNLVFRIPFLIPTYRDRSFAKAYAYLMDVFFSAYDEFAPLKNAKQHTALSVEETLAIEPGFNPDKLLGALTMDEWGVDVYRLCTLNVLDAIAHGAVVDNHTTVLSVLRDAAGNAAGLRVRDDAAGGVMREVAAKLVINCTGAWNAKLKLGLKAPVRPGKGVHLIFDGRISDYALVTFAVDGRQVFLMPHQNEAWFGTTDDDYFGDPDALTVTQDEVEYLYTAAERVFPRIRDYRCFATSVGLRPTLHEWGPNEDDLSREHEIVDHAADGAPGVLSAIGGKLASYRVFSEEIADKALALLGRPHTASRTAIDALPGHAALVDPAALAREYAIDGVAARRLVRRQGTLAAKILHAGRQTPGGLSTVCACEPVLECEVRHVMQHEVVRSPLDLTRRCRVGVGPCLGARCANRVGQIYSEEKGGGALLAQEAAHAIAAQAIKRALPVLDDALERQVASVTAAVGRHG